MGICFICSSLHAANKHITKIKNKIRSLISIINSGQGPYIRLNLLKITEGIQNVTTILRQPAVIVWNNFITGKIGLI